MDTTPTLPLARFRAELYQTVLGMRRDALSELLDAVLTGERATSLVRLSLAPVFRRGWASAPDALAAGSLDAAALRRLCGRSLPAPSPGWPPLWVIDGSIWPRPEAKTSPERTWGRFVTAGTPESGIIGAWEYQWLAAIPEPAGSWVLPLDVRRRGPTAGTATALAIAQVRDALAATPAGLPRPVVALDSHYDLVALIEADLAVAWLVRLACHRVFFRPPPAYAGKGRPRTHGPVLRLKDPATHGAPARTQREADPDYGTVTIDVWEGLHTQAAPTVEFAVLRITVAHLPRRSEPPAPLWLAWHGASLPADLRELWRWYQRRFAIEHGLRFLKQDLGWTTIRPRSPATADRWSWLLAAALWQLWLARPLVADARLPWERPAPPARLSPGRVRRQMSGLLAGVGTPARAPRPRGKSPGRRRGQCPGRAPRFPVCRRGPPAAPLAP